MKKIEIDSELVTGVLDLTVTLDFRLSDNPFISFIKANTTLNMVYVLGIISKEELRNLQELLYVNYAYFTEFVKDKSKQELNEKFGFDKEGGTN